MPEPLPQRVEPYRLAREGRTVRGTVAGTELARLAEAVLALDGDAEAEVAFGTDAAGVPHAAGRVRMRVRLVCQRCLEPMAVALDVPLRVGFVRSEAAARALPAEYDPVVIEAGAALALARLVEDELLLALPIVPRHGPDEACAGRERLAALAEAARPPGALAALGELWQRRGSR